MKRGKKIISLKDHKDMMDAMRQLYGNDEVKNDDKNAIHTNNTERESGTKGNSPVPKLPPNCS